MKFKPFAMSAIFGLLAISLTAPMTALADDPNDNNNDIAASQPQQAGPSDNMPSSVAQNDGSVGDTAVNTDQATPDTATGDDDY